MNIATDPTLPDVNSVGTLAKIDFRKFWNRVLESVQEERGKKGDDMSISRWELLGRGS